MHKGHQGSVQALKLCPAVGGRAAERRLRRILSCRQQGVRVGEAKRPSLRVLREFLVPFVMNPLSARRSPRLTDDGSLVQAGPSFAGSIRARRSGRSAMIPARSASVKPAQPPISDRVRRQPRQRLEAPSTTQTLMQGVAIERGGSVTEERHSCENHSEDGPFLLQFIHPYAI